MPAILIITRSTRCLLRMRARRRPCRFPRAIFFYQFRKDVNEGKLPAISWLTAPEKFSDHPTSAWYGAWYISEVMDILTKNPEVWKKTIFILTYDENDGYFDHAPSFVAADPKRPETGGASAGIDTGLEYSYKEDELRQGVAENEARIRADGHGISRADDHCFAMEPRRMGELPALRPHLDADVSGTIHSRASTARRFAKRTSARGGERSPAISLRSFAPMIPKKPALDFLNRNKFVVSIEKARYKEIPSNYTKAHRRPDRTDQPRLPSIPR